MSWWASKSKPIDVTKPLTPPPLWDPDDTTQEHHTLASSAPGYFSRRTKSLLLSEIDS